MKKTSTLFFTSILSLIVSCASAQSFGFQWAKQIAGPNNDMTMGITTDAAGNIYNCGNFDGTTDFDPGAGTFTMTSVTGGGGYASKLDANGNLVWAVAFPGQTLKTAVDASGNVFVTGTFNGTQDFDPGSGTFTLTPASTNYPDMYVCKIDNSGNFVFAGRIGGNDKETPTSMTADASGNIIITGLFKNTVDFDPMAATTYTMFSNGQDDGFVVKLDNSCNFLWGAKFGSSASYEQTSDAATDAAGNVYITGAFAGNVDFDPSVMGYSGLSSPSSVNIYLLKLDAAGNFGWVNGFGSTSVNDESRAIALDAAGNIHIAGAYAGTVDFDPSATATSTLTAVGGLDCFVAKYDASGNYIFAKGFGSAAYDCCKDIKVSGNGTICYTGVFFQNADFDPSAAGTYTMASAGANDAFLAALDNTGNFLWAGNLSPWSYDAIEELAITGTGDLYACGAFMFSTDFDPSSAVFNMSSSGFDGFILKLSGAGVGIKENNLNNAVSVYPNPFTNVITLSSEKINLQQADVIITDVTGRQIEKLSNLNSYNTQINLEQLKAGVYFYSIIEKNKTLATGKIIKH
ncbi:MAG: T9SS type A sorting domain-containing protein [Bacteroidota bacterium]